MALMRFLSWFLILSCSSPALGSADECSLSGTCQDAAGLLQHKVQLDVFETDASQVEQTTIPTTQATTCPANYPHCDSAGDCVIASCKNGCDNWANPPSPSTPPGGLYNYLSGYDNSGAACTGNYVQATSTTTTTSTSSTSTTSTTTTTLASTAFNYRPLKYFPVLNSYFTIQSCQNIKNANNQLLPIKVRNGFAQVNKTKCVQVFGLVIAGTQKASSNWMRYFANIAANLLDPDCDGKPDDQNTVKLLDKFAKEDAPWLNLGHDQLSEQGYTQVPGYGFSGQTWKAAGNPKAAPPIILEEMFHMVHSEAWAKVYPKTIGYKAAWVRAFPNNQQSLACLCMREAQCKWYQHPENYGCTSLNGTFCKNPAITGDASKAGTIPGTCYASKIGSLGCNGASCDCIEFFHKIYTSWLGNTFNGYDRMGNKLKNAKARGLNQRQAVEELLGQSTKCSELLVHMKSNALKLPKKHIEETYTCAGPVPAPSPPPPTPAPPAPPAGEAACENKGFTQVQCQNVGCCLWAEGSCWANQADKCVVSK